MEEITLEKSETGSKVLVVVGFGSGVSASVAEKFGLEGFRIALISRNMERHDLHVGALRQKGLQVSSFQADATHPDSIQAALRAVRLQCGPITVLHWNASGGEPRDLLVADSASIRGVLDVSVVGLLAAVQELLPDLERNGDGAILVTNGSAGEIEQSMDRFVSGLNAMDLKLMGTALANAAKDKLVGMLGERLEGNRVYVGQVMIDGTVKGTAWDRPDSIDPQQIADMFWNLYRGRRTRRARVSAHSTGWIKQQSSAR